MNVVPRRAAAGKRFLIANQSPAQVLDGHCDSLLFMFNATVCCPPIDFWWHS
ncbi:hypothetical protein SERLADRAFT_457125 [Serpula lacrymans var. lacrymans S7.9]|nr:uncharacterized protein SERLADRAFT_457125 [Serpula lacrymans var. lacrymans S7.9]EGO29413.1 hypothetical protein SERLADRAFT_457125 [Serpula lacrymans var. lacrymans S7.9]